MIYRQIYEYMGINNQWIIIKRSSNKLIKIISIVKLISLIISKIRV
jgi:hypothetical protein